MPKEQGRKHSMLVRVVAGLQRNNHALHEFHVRLRPRRQLSRCGRRQPFSRFSGCSRLDYYWPRRTFLLCVRGITKEIC